MYAILGATGNVGRVIAHRLLSQGKRVRVIGRSRAKLRLFELRGAEALVGDVRDRGFTERAFNNAEAVFAMIPPDLRAEDYRAHQDHVTDQIVHGVRANGIRHVVTLSSLGAHIATIEGAVRGNRYMEQQLNEVKDLNVVHLRPCYFMSNLRELVPMLKATSTISYPISPSIAVPWIAPCDIGWAGAELLNQLEFSGKSHRELLGQQDLTFERITQVLGLVLNIDKPRYQQVEWNAFASGLRKAGISDKTLETMHWTIKGVGRRALLEGIERTKENTTHTSIEEWAEQYVG